MDLGFWSKLDKPFLVLAPMEEITDTVFRRMLLKVDKQYGGRPDVMFTEFTNARGINSSGAGIVGQRLVFTEEEKPIVAQIWGIKPEDFFTAAQKICNLEFDGIDINFGCPVKEITKQGACSAMIGQNQQVAEIITAVKQGAPNLPVSVKTRLGIKRIATDEWIGFLLTLDLAAITIHGRTAAEKSAGAAHWDEIGKVVKLRDSLQKQTLIIGNGDIKDRRQASEFAREYGVDGVMIGRGVLTNILAFTGYLTKLSPEERSRLLLDQINLFRQVWQDKKNFSPMKKFVKLYISGFDGAAEIRAQLMTAGNIDELEQMVKGVLH